MRRLGPLQFAAAHVPQAELGIVTALGHGLTVGRECQGADAAAARREPPQLLAGADVPEPREVMPVGIFIVTPRRHQLAIRRERTGVDHVGMGERADQAAGRRVYQVNRLAGRGEGDGLAIGGELGPVGDCPTLPGLRHGGLADFLAGRGVAEGWDNHLLGPVHPRWRGRRPRLRTGKSDPPDRRGDRRPDPLRVRPCQRGLRLCVLTGIEADGGESQMKMPTALLHAALGRAAPARSCGRGSRRAAAASAPWHSPCPTGVDGR